MRSRQSIISIQSNKSILFSSSYLRKSSLFKIKSRSYLHVAIPHIPWNYDPYLIFTGVGLDQSITKKKKKKKTLGISPSSLKLRKI